MNQYRSQNGLFISQKWFKNELKHLFVPEISIDVTNWHIERTTSSNISEENKSYEETTQKKEAVHRVEPVKDNYSFSINYQLKQKD